jgi:uroporphyrinogen-III synthase
MRLLITRPEPDALKLKALLERLGHEAIVDPLLRVSFDDGDPIELDGAQALVATSRNALRALRSSQILPAARKLPLFAVGQATANEARSLGFTIVVAGAGDAQQLVTHIVSVADPSEGLLVHLAGEHLAGNIRSELEAHGFRVMQPIVYRMIPATALTDDTVEQLAQGEIDGVMLLSPRTAGVYERLIRKHGLAQAVRHIVHFCMSDAVARALEPLGLLSIEVAEAPRLEEMLALIEETAANFEG